MNDSHFLDTIAFFPFNTLSQSGLWVDYSRRSCVGSVGDGAPTLSQTTHKTGDASLLLDGASSVVIEARDLLKTSDFTIEFWIYPRILTAGGIGNGESAGAWSVCFSASGEVSFWDGANAVVTSAANSVRENVWQHVAVVREGVSVRLYVDGVQVADASGGVPDFSTAGNIVVGKKGTAFLDCHLNDLRITKAARYTSPNFTPPTSFPYDDFETRFFTFIPNAFIAKRLRQFENVSQKNIVAGEYIVIRTSDSQDLSFNPSKAYLHGAGYIPARSHNGRGRIYGRVTEKAKELGDCLLRLYSRKSGMLVAETRTTESGVYEFNNLDLCASYTLIAFYPDSDYNSIIRDLITPEID